MAYDAFFFDLYGTLVDILTDESDPALWQKTAAYFSARGAAWEPQELRSAYHRETGRQEALLCAAYPEIDLAPVFSELFRLRGVQPDADTVADAAWFFRRTSTKHIRLYSGAWDLIDALRARGRVILLSNAQRLFTVPELQLLGLMDRFDAIYLSSDYGCKKPDPAFFGRALSDENLNPKKCIMIGNDPFTDAAGARGVGMDAYCIRSATSPKEAPIGAYDQPKMSLARVKRLLLGKQS